jgi:putative nucleotidyltransferase with HDIG domain
MSNEDQIRQTLIDTLPELAEIKDEALRGQVVDAWTYSLSRSSFDSIDEIPASGNPDTPALKSGTQADHIRGVTRLAIGIADTLVDQFPDLPVNRDLLVACALCHDVGKPFEFDPKNQERWRENQSATGYPAIRHTQYGTHVCLTVGLPEEVCHAAGCHSGEGELVKRSLHVTIIHHADYAFWRSLAAGGALES